MRDELSSPMIITNRTGDRSVIATPNPKGVRPPIRFLSVCSGVEAASQALIPLGGFKCAGVSEIEPHPCHVLAHRFGASRPVNMPRPEDVPVREVDGTPRTAAAIEKERRARANAIKAVKNLPMQGEITNFGDMGRFQEWPDADIDGLFGGTPCQSFSVAGLRKGLADPRGNLMLTYGAIAARFRPRWLLWENVPGVLSSHGGRDFAGFLGLLTGQQIDVPDGGWKNSGIVAGIADAYGLAWRVLDAQHVRTRSKRRAVPQRRRRVFVIGYLGDWTRAAAVLFDAESLRRDPPPRREAGQGIAAATAPCLTGGGRGVERAGESRGQDPIVADVDTRHLPEVCNAIAARDAKQPRAEDNVGIIAVRHQPVAPTLRGEGFDATDDGTGKGTPIIPVVFDSKGSQVQTDETGASPTLRAMTHADSHQNGGGKLAVAFAENQRGELRTSEVAMQLTTGGGKAGQGYAAVAYDMRGREGGAQLEGPHDTANIRASSGGSSRPYVAQPWAVRENPTSGPGGVGVQEGHAYTLEARQEVQAVAFSHEPHKPVGVRQEIANGNATEADAGEILRGVRDALGEEAFSQWGLGILDMLQSPEILRSALHGCELRPAPFTRRWVVDCALSRQEDRGTGAVQSLRQAGGDGCASSGWEPSEQRAHELGAYLSELSQPGAQAERFMLDLWRASEGIGLLREALSAVQEARRPSRGEGQPAQTTWQVRRLTPDECEFLQGMPRGTTNVPWRGKDFSPDGNRYKELGNSWALNCIEWIGERMLIVDAWD